MRLRHRAVWFLAAMLLAIVVSGFLRPTGVEGLEAGPATSHSVDLPLTGRFTCRNFCGPTGRCIKTGQQCLADIDCPGCQEPKSPEDDPMTFAPYKSAAEAAPSTDAGKLTVGVTPQFSPLTHGYGTKERKVATQRFPPPAQANFGVDVWSGPANQAQQLFDDRYRLPRRSLQFLPDYPNRPSLTGMFTEDGPLPSNT